MKDNSIEHDSTREYECGRPDKLKIQYTSDNKKALSGCFSTGTFGHFGVQIGLGALRMVLISFSNRALKDTRKPKFF